MSKKVIDEHAKRVASRTIQSLNSTTEAKKQLDQLVQPYTTAQNQHIFLKALNRESAIALAEHRKGCKKADCAQVIGYNYLSFAIEQELDKIFSNYSPGDYKNTEEFSTEEKLKISDKIEEILEQLNNVNLGQQILFEEINSLREHFNLDKKSWVQLLKGKLFEMATEKVIELTVAEMIFKTITESIKGGHFLLPK